MVFLLVAAVDAVLAVVDAMVWPVVASVAATVCAMWLERRSGRSRYGW
ncbi:hypothetical protein [Lentzea guizhouensis]|nr:hypothetical protein [Lentzea guizhouensis]